MKWLVIAALVLGGCGKKKQEEAPAPTPVATGSGSAAGSDTGSAAAGSDTGSATAAAGSAVDVPTEQDFEEQAKTEITDKNVEAQLKTIESDLSH